jgi:hypothetical protein|tara:strand:+ start:326 stop:1186 length:861 start_codon:yes stop_codon:yes gene_type:complete
MKTVNSLSGGKTSSYIAVHYPADYNVFALVRTSDKECMFPDPKVRQLVSDKLGEEFIGTLEQDEIIYTILDLEQFIGQKIHWLTGPTFDDVIVRGDKKTGGEYLYLPNVTQRYCTTELKVNPIKQWCYENIELPVDMRIGFRANEVKRANSMINRYREDGYQWEKFIIGKSKTGLSNRYKEMPYRVCSFPLIHDNIYKDQIESYWKDKPVRFAYLNNCVGCFHRNEMLLKHMSQKSPNKFDWFARQENDKARFKKGTRYEDIKSFKMQFQLFDEDFNECDSGYCGL